MQNKDIGYKSPNYFISKKGTWKSTLRKIDCPQAIATLDAQYHYTFPCSIFS